MLRAAWGTVLFFFVAPAMVGGLVPWLLAGEHDPAAPAAVAAGVLLAVAGLVVLVACFVRFVREGGGTPAPVAPTRELVVGGVYRFVRNPMYLAVGAVIAGQALMFASLAVLVWLVIFAVAVVAFVVGYEQPTLRYTYGSSYDAYCKAVPAWWPRLTPWRGAASSR
jgi:protein-S-isoprenylcysteine O-methyltransferase Ste14